MSQKQKMSALIRELSEAVNAGMRDGVLVAPLPLKLQGRINKAALAITQACNETEGEIEIVMLDKPRKYVSRPVNDSPRG